MNILFLGPQGSGKGTQAHLLKDKFHLNYFDMGAFLRETAKSNQELAQKLSKGELLTDELVVPLVINFLEENHLFNDMVYDGFPRRATQLHLLQAFLNEKGTKLDYAIYLSLPEEETINRLSARRIHRKTGEIYNLITNPPGNDINPDDLVHREDDMPEAIKRRLKAFHLETEPLIEELRKTTNFIEIDGSQSIEKIHEDILKKLEFYDKNDN